MKKQEALQVGKIIEIAMAKAGCTDEFARQQACYIWPDIVGPTINRYTTRRWVDRDVLHVCITSAPLKNELSFHIARLVEKINEAVGRNALSTIVLH